MNGLNNILVVVNDIQTAKKKFLKKKNLFVY